MSDEPDLAGAADAVRRQLWGAGHRGRLEVLDRFEPEFAQVVVEQLFGRIYPDERLSLRDRSLCTVAILMALGRSRQLTSHIEGALRLGISASELSALAVHGCAYAGLPATIDALHALAAALATHGSTPASNREDD